MPKSIKICIDDKCFEHYLDIIEGKKKVTDEVRAIIVECGRARLKKSRSFYKGKLTSDIKNSNFTKPLKRKTSKSHARPSNRKSASK